MEPVGRADSAFRIPRHARQGVGELRKPARAARKALEAFAPMSHLKTPLAEHSPDKPLRSFAACRVQSFQKSAFTKFAHGCWLAAGVGERLVARASLWRRPQGRACVADRRFPRISTVISLLFFLGPSATRAAGGGPAHDPRLQEEANVLETRRKSIGPSAHLRRREEKVSWLGDGRRCFSLLFTMWGVADRACNHTPKLSAKDDRRRGVPVHAYLSSSFRFVDFTSAPQ